MTSADFIAKHADTFDKDRTFAICSYVPPWHGHDSLKLTREHFKNVFTYYPASDKNSEFYKGFARLAADGETKP